jgi:hypothetical protein
VAGDGPARAEEPANGRAEAGPVAAPRGEVERVLEDANVARVVDVFRGTVVAVKPAGRPAGAPAPPAGS